MKASVALLLLLAVHLVSSPAEACVCGPAARVIWPLEGARDVPRELPLVIAMYGAPGIAHWQLETSSGDAVEVAVARALPLAGLNGQNCESTLLFVTSSSPLEPDTEYRVRTGQPQEPDEVLSFRTGDAAHADLPAEVVLEYDRLLEATRNPHAEPLDGVELRVQDRDVAEPSLLLVPGEDEAAGMAILTGSAWRRIAGPALALPIPVDTACVDVQQISMSGASVSTRSLCEPDRCARLADDTYPGGSSCDSWFTLGDDFWDALPDASCDSVPTVHVDDESGAVDVEGIGDADDRPVRELPVHESGEGAHAQVESEAASGCELAPYPAARLPTCMLALAIVLCRAARRRAPS